MPKILVADDNTNIQKMVSLALSERGIDVVSVGNGEAAVRRLPELVPDLVLADIFMPVRNGYEVCEYVKKDPRFSHIPVILLVGAFDPLDEKEAHRVGADGVLKKPFVPPDPLIAMVMSVLEKNPKLAAELASPKKTPVEPPKQSRPVNYTKPEAHARAVAKIPNEFPEPSPEDAAQVYGFGSGRRTIDPAAVPGDAQVPKSDDTEEFDGAATTSDWRRSARDFEVPEETAHNPAFAEDQSNSPVFPLSAVSPQGSQFAEQANDIAPVISETVEEIVGAATAEHPLPEEGKTRETPVALEAFAPVEVPPPVEVLQAAEVVPAIANADIALPVQIEQAPDVTPSAKENESLPQVLVTPLVEVETEHESGRTSKAAGWIESIFPAKYPKGGWFSSLKSPAKTTEAETASARTELVEVPVAEPIQDLETVSHSEAQESSPTPEVQPKAEIDRISSGQPTPAPEPVLAIQAIDEESFFAEEPEEPESPSVISTSVVEEAAPVESASVVSETVTVANENSASEPWSPRRAIFGDTDPALIEPPAVRVVPEPLLVNDDLRESSSKYGGRAEQLPPAHSFLIPTAQAPDSEKSAGDQPGWNGHHEVLHSETRAEEESERIPTGPLPSREALSQIPFLSPPPEFHQAAVQSASAGNAEMIDAIVRKVLERIEPQLHELLSKDLLKPLVESILQNGNRKTDH